MAGDEKAVKAALSGAEAAFKKFATEDSGPEFAASISVTFDSDSLKSGCVLHPIAFDVLCDADARSPRPCALRPVTCRPAPSAPRISASHTRNSRRACPDLRSPRLCYAASVASSSPVSAARSR